MRIEGRALQVSVWLYIYRYRSGVVDLSENWEEHGSFAGVGWPEHRFLFIPNIKSIQCINAHSRNNECVCILNIGILNPFQVFLKWYQKENYFIRKSWNDCLCRTSKSGVFLWPGLTMSKWDHIWFWYDHDHHELGNSILVILTKIIIWWDLTTSM